MSEDYITEADAITDEGEYFAKLDCFLMDREDILEDRDKRLKNLIGRYVIICEGHKSYKLCYLQDQRISNKGYWTNFLSNALGFKSKEQAIKKFKKFKYNNPLR